MTRNEKVIVTPAQHRAAQILVEIYEASGKEVPDKIRKISQATPSAMRTNRGLQYLIPIRAEGDVTVSVQESSSADDAHIWLTVDPDGIAHLTLSQAEIIRDQIDYLIQHHRMG